MTFSFRLAYGAHPSQFGELYLPSGSGQVPVVVVVHGGYWRQQYGADLGTPLAIDLAAHGVAAWNLEYRRVGGDGGWPSTFLDVAAGFDLLAGPAQDAANGRLDLSRVVSVGHSAGGHLAVWAAARHRLPLGAPGAAPVIRPVGVVSQAGVLDLAAGSVQRLGDGAVDELLGSASPAVYRLTSPAELVPIGIPVVCLHGDRDASVPIDQSERYARAALAGGDLVELVRLPGAGHFEVIDAGSGEWAACRDAALRLGARGL